MLQDLMQPLGESFGERIFLGPEEWISLTCMRARVLKDAGNYSGLIFRSDRSMLTVREAEGHYTFLERGGVVTEPLCEEGWTQMGDR